MSHYEVAVLGLNLRSTPRVARGNVRAVLPQGQRLERIAVAKDSWWLVRAALRGVAVEGFVASRFLEPAPAEVAPEQPMLTPGIPVAHLERDRPEVTRSSANGRAYPLGEAGRPARPAGDPAARAEALTAIVEWLGVDNPNHRRWAREGNATFCNVYAHDYCCLAGAYLPRVWWTGSALAQLARGVVLLPRYGVTVRERNANALFDWLVDFGAAFGWRRTFEFDTLQEHANHGAVALVAAQRRELDQPGHLVAVVPETEVAMATRVDGRVVAPLQSQAGRSNHRYTTDRWWTAPKFREVGLWWC
jgi:hypothetical protein